VVPRAGWGVFMHYLADSAELPTAEWNRRIDGFDVEGLARQLESAKARYFFITLGQNSGHYLAPNKTYDSFVGIQPSKCSRRDLVADLYAALEPRGIKLLVYLPAGAPDKDKTAMEKLQWQSGPHRNLEFQRKWEQVIADWSTRWGGKVKGGGSTAATGEHHVPASHAAQLCELRGAARKGNPASIVAFNRGWWCDPLAIGAGGLHCGRDRRPEQSVVRQLLGGRRAVAHAELPRQVVERRAGAVYHRRGREDDHAHRGQSGVVTWDTPHGADGLIGEPFLGQLRAIGKRWRESGGRVG